MRTTHNWVFYTGRHKYGRVKAFCFKACKRPEITNVWKDINMLLDKNIVEQVGYMTEQEWARHMWREQL